jgi:hypothetical protein
VPSARHSMIQKLSMWSLDSFTLTQASRRICNELILPLTCSVSPHHGHVQYRNHPWLLEHTLEVRENVAECWGQFRNASSCPGGWVSTLSSQFNPRQVSGSATVTMAAGAEAEMAVPKFQFEPSVFLFVSGCEFVLRFVLGNLVGMKKKA